ncbi:SDR family NAD(P)-dependent oxidoreductase [Roseiterribacter gracilis]|uniref:D-xylose 1-dehydrogenase n=1 Tax=Roseiterribacter gracilis TaxID=2812848 RepID=A0A8S8XGQ2_9PROT|nr:D-xylose 1-dehydrogenase [Rhodospirillales bacterium TMPK1]
MNHANYPSLSGKRVVVTGGGSGIGAAIVEAFARQDAQVFFLDVAEEDSRALVERLAQMPTPPVFYRCDLTDLDAARACLDAIIEQHGSVDVLVNNAANDDRHRVDEVTPSYWDERIAVNLKHYFFCAQTVAPGMRANSGGAIINLGSVSWHLALPDLAIYQTAKAGIEGMTRALARDLGEDKIRVTCVVPGGVRTPRQTLLWHNPAEEARMLAQQCLKERVEPSHVASMILFLASDDGRMCTGHEYFVDAGWR